MRSRTTTGQIIFLTSTINVHREIKSSRSFHKKKRFEMTSFFRTGVGEHIDHNDFQCLVLFLVTWEIFGFVLISVSPMGLGLGNFC